MRLETKIPEYNLLGAFWKNIRNDITGNGCILTIDGLSHLSYERRVTEERRILRKDALDFIYTQDFVQWADVSGANPEALREDLLNAYLNS